MRILMKALSCALAMGLGVAAGPAWSQRDAGAVTLVEQAADALGGRERVRAVRNISLQGYGQYVYQFGGGNITGDPEAPMKYQAANDLQRIYDVEGNRFQQLERRNFLFPFLGIGGHAYTPVNLILDGDLAYDVLPDGKMRRVIRSATGVLQHDGVHMRRMWSLNNPVVLIRRALDPATQLRNRRTEGSLTLIDGVLAEGDKFTFALRGDSKLPAWFRWTNPHENLGQVAYTTHFTGYAPYGGLLLPLGLTTRLDWRNIEYFKLYVDNYTVDTQIADLAAPADIRATPEPQRPAPNLTATQVAKGVWRITPTGTTVFEFADHLKIFELGGGQQVAKAVLAYIRTVVPGKPITHLIASHNHFDHVAGMRQAIAEDITIVSRRGSESVFSEMAAHRAPDFPDDLERTRTPFKFVPVDEHLRFSDAQMTVDVYWARANIHMADAVFAYVPAAKVIVEGDIATAALDYQFWGDNYMDNIEYYKLDVETISPAHMQIMKQAEVIEMVKGGVQRARERCASELAKGNYFPGCPVQSKRY